VKDRKYILYLSAAIGLFVAVKLLSPKQYNWTVTFSHEDKNPYGGYALYQLLPDLFGKPVRQSYKSLYELKDSLPQKSNLMILATSFSAGNEDTEALLNFVASGGTAFIAAQNFWGKFPDTLKLSTYDYFFKDGSFWGQKDTSTLHFVNSNLDTLQQFYYRRDNIHNYFNRFDTTRTTIIAKNDKGYPVSVRVAWGKGNLILNCTPLAFTNIYLLAHRNSDFVSTTLSYLPKQPLHWTEFYHLGRMEARTPLRFILTQEPLKWSYYIAILSLLLFMIFEMKRRQRVIPVITPPANTTLEFVTTIGNLYYQNKAHKSIAEKKINFFLEQLRSTYWINTTVPDDTFFETLSRKSGRDKNQIMDLFKLIRHIQDEQQIPASVLLDLNEKIEAFNRKL
jgi:hypothetical protein